LEKRWELSKNTHHFSPRICIGWKSKEFIFFATIFPTLSYVSRSWNQNTKKPVFNQKEKPFNNPTIFFFFDPLPLRLELVLAGVVQFSPSP